ncbi:Monooxygenase, FAD-binding protein [Cordyceps fumosorosea ARSEF 2679]|uniref:Monooxygenase, FAD-binding protein n=1 Tax=Cordyceps fumosorosea (strain ARSEF 2679) TaxID=1081104 RepID=A0A168ELQ0_CORFA|nr:Monooxygenase, FAD-binding protein [Cordyceps fumosorosea ARSEF 2679]OAA73961.1 Monooxygenase, FAD-binding protein [Cordyceps fumosorosea ARSEF 2679]
MPKYNFKVVVVGGGPTGLALANMLEQLEIDYILLEAHADITPRIGTGIFLSNSLRVLDQLGCLDAFYAGADEVDDLSVTVDAVTMFSPATAEHFNQSCHRQHLLNVLFNNLRDQSKILTNKRVGQIVETETGVDVITTDGDVYSGHIVIGADGVHSIVRKEMRRMAAKASPNHPLVTEEDDVEIQYATLFGIAYIDKPFPPRLLAMAANQGRSYLTYGNAEGRIFWGLMERLPEPIKGSKAPRYTQAEMDALVEKRFDDEVVTGVTLGDLWKGSSETNGMLPLQNWVFDTWHFGRLVTVGDSAHKMVPITGQGCNMAIQDAAALVNALSRRLDQLGDRISKSELESAFRETETARQTHVEYSRSDAFEMQESQAMQNGVFNRLFPLLAGSLSLDAKHEVNRAIMFNTARLDKLPLPHRPHFIPFADELPAKNIDSGLWNAGAMAAYAGLWVAARMLCTTDDAPASFTRSILQHLTGSGQDAWLGSRGTATSTLYSTSLLTTVTIYWTLERYRRCNRQAMLGPLMKYTGLYSVATDVLGATAVVPAYLGLTELKNTGAVANIMVGRPVRPAVIKSLAPAVVISFAVAAAAFCVAARTQHPASAASLWRLAPLLVAPVTQALYARTKDEQALKNDKEGFLDVHNGDLPSLKALYAVVTAAAAAAHVGLVVLPWLRGSAQASEVLDLFRAREALVLAGSLVGGALTSIVSTRAQGYATTWSAVRAGLASLISVAMFGPAAVFTAARYWKEVTTARYCFWKHEKDGSGA